jgi:hypothetical protein
METNTDSDDESAVTMINPSINNQKKSNEEIEQIKEEEKIHMTRNIAGSKFKVNMFINMFIYLCICRCL